MPLFYKHLITQDHDVNNTSMFIIYLFSFLVAGEQFLDTKRNLQKIVFLYLLYNKTIP